MTTRRELIKIASALGLAGTVPTMAERIDAAKLLGQAGSARNILNPAAFAVETNLTMGNDTAEFGPDWMGVVCPEDNAAYSQAVDRLERTLKAHGIDNLREVGDFGAASLTLVLAMYDAGIRHGAAYENLRRSLVGETVQCSACWGVGISRHDDATCTTCGGTGTIALTD